MAIEEQNRKPGLRAFCFYKIVSALSEGNNYNFALERIFKINICSGL